MSKRIVLKSVLAIVMAGFILSSCQKDEKKIVGKWLLEKVEVKDFACSDPLVTAMLKPIVQQIVSSSGTEFEFTKEGKAIFSNDGKAQVSSYKVNDKKLTITNSDNSIEAYDLSFSDKKTMHWEIDMNKSMLEDLSEYIESVAWMYYGISLEEDLEITKCKLKYSLIKR